MKIFIVTSGEYSDYGIDNVFLDEKVANDYVTTKNKVCGYLRGKYQVEEYETSDEEPFKKIHELKKYWRAHFNMFSSNKVVIVDEIFVENDEDDPRLRLSPDEEFVRNNSKLYINWDTLIRFCSAASSKSPEHAEKILYDHVAKMKAIHEGITT